MVITVPVYLCLLAALSLERVVEMVRSSRNHRRALAHGGREAGQGHYPFMVAFHSLFIASCAAEVILFSRPFPGLVGWIALAAALIAQALRAWVIATLGERWNTRVVVLPNAAPITSGPYRWLRHPNYLAVIIEMAAVPLIHGCWLTAIVFSAGNACLLAVRIPAEEAALGAQYKSFFGARPRLLPRLLLR
jgi:methyltransferase